LSEKVHFYLTTYNTGADGTLDDGGDNIISVAGTYSFVLDFTDPDNPTYTIN
jgi:hypothetical protein